MDLLTLLTVVLSASDLFRGGSREKDQESAVLQSLALMISTYRISRAVCPADNPDWRKPYGYLREMNDEAIAFEFLRRNLSYWEAYARALALPPDPTEWPKDGPTQFKMGPDPEYEKFGLRAFCDPRSRPWALGSGTPWAPEVSLNARYIDALARADARGDFYYTLRNAGFIKMRVDLLITGPIEEQVDFVRWLLNRAKRSWGLTTRQNPRPSRHFDRYLRLLDARSDGASYAEIAEYLCPKQAGAIDRLKKQLKAATLYRDRGYRDLLLWGKITVPNHLAERKSLLDGLTREK